jgi:hypothetical protein
MDVLEVLASSMTGFGGDSVKACFNSWSSVDAVSLSAVSQLSLSQSKARLTSNCIVSAQKFSRVLKVMGRDI